MERRKSLLIVLLSCIVVFSLFACAAANRATQPTAKADSGVAPEQQMQPYNGPKASIIVGRFTWKVGGQSSTTTVRRGGEEVATITHEHEGYLGGLQDMLTTSLVQCGRYDVYSRQDFTAIQDEISLAERGYVEKKTAVQKGTTKGADLLVVAAVTGWEPSAQRQRGGGTTRIPGMPALPISRAAIGGGFHFSKSMMAMDLRIIDMATSRIVASTRVEGEAKELSFGGFMRTIPLAGGLGVYSQTPMEKAIRVCLNEAIKYVVSATPSKYYKY